MAESATPGNRMRALRQHRHLSGRWIAERLHISPQYYYDLERGRRRLNEDLLPRLAEVFGVSTDYLLGRVPNPDVRLLDSPEAEAMIERIIAALPPDLYEWLCNPKATAWIEVSREAEEYGLRPKDIERVIEFLREEKARWEKEDNSAQRKTE